jgi:hypothetical protein
MSDDPSPSLMSAPPINVVPSASAGYTEESLAANAKPRLDLAVSLEAVRGSQANYMQALFAMVASIVASLAGLAAVDADTGGVVDMGVAKGVFGFAVLLFVCSSLGLSKTVRDRSFADAFALAAGAGPAGALRAQLRGSDASLYAAVFGATASMCLAGASVLLLNGHGTSANHLFAGIAFCMTSTVTVAKVVRDRFDADFIEASGLTAGTRQLAILLRISDSLIGGTQAFFCVILSSGLDAVTKIIVTTCVFFLAVASINASKMVRDKIDRSRGAAQNTVGWNLVTTLSFIIAFVAAVTGTFFVCRTGVLSSSMCAFINTGMIWVLASVLTFSKVARDYEERGRSASA